MSAKLGGSSGGGDTRVLWRISEYVCASSLCLCLKKAKKKNRNGKDVSSILRVIISCREYLICGMAFGIFGKRSAFVSIWWPLLKG